MDNQHSLEWELIIMLKSVINKLIVAIIVISMLFSGTVAAFIWYINQYDFESSETQISASTDSNGTAIAVLNSNKGQVNFSGKGDDSSEDEN